MKRILRCIAWVLVVVSLAGCGQQAAPAETAAQTQPATVPVTEPPATEPPPANELAWCAYYDYREYADDGFTSCFIHLYPGANILTFSDGSKQRYLPFTQNDQGQLVVEDADETWVFRKTETGLVIETGTLYAYNSDTEAHIPLPAGTEIPYESSLVFPGGVYTLDTSEYDYTFEEVLLDVDFLSMTYVLRCYDGEVVSGDMSVVAGKDYPYLMLSCADGVMAFTPDQSGGIAYLQYRHDYYLPDEQRSGWGRPANPIGFLPQNEQSLRGKFVYRQDQNVELPAEEPADTLSAHKRVYENTYIYYLHQTEGEKLVACDLRLYHYPLFDQWRMNHEDMDSIENEDGTITLSDGKNSWNFHWEEDDLCFDGGSSLLLPDITMSDGSKKKGEAIEPGSVFLLSGTDYVYDQVTYVFPKGTINNYIAAIRLDLENRTAMLHCGDGQTATGEFSLENDTLYFRTILRTLYYPDEVRIRIDIRDHAIGITNPFATQIVSEDGFSYATEYFVPVITSNLRFRGL